MNKLISANLSRLKKDRAFIFCIGFMFILGVGASIWAATIKARNRYEMQPERLYVFCPIVIGILSAAFCSLFTGTQYSDGVIRNKLVIGNSRSTVYFSELITNSIACLFMFLVFAASASAIGLPILGMFENTSSAMLILAVIAAMTLAFTAIYTLIAMLNQNKSTTAVICLIGFIAFLAIAAYLNSRLQEPEVFDSYTYMNSAGKIITDNAEPNPNYLTGKARTVFELILDFLPTGQALLMTDMSAHNPAYMPLCSLIIIILSTVCGCIIFRKKDIK